MATTNATSLSVVDIATIVAAIVSVILLISTFEPKHLNNWLNIWRYLKNAVFLSVAVIVIDEIFSVFIDKKTTRDHAHFIIIFVVFAIYAAYQIWKSRKNKPDEQMKKHNRSKD